MNYTSNNLTEYLVSLISLAGEIPKDISIKGINPKTIQNNLSSGKKNMLLKIDKEHNRVRLRAPKGLEYLREISEELYEHYMMISNNHKFQRSERSIANLKAFSETVLFFVNNGYEIDNIRITYKPNHFGKNAGLKNGVESVLGESEIYDIGMSKFFSNGKIIPVQKATALKIAYEKKFYTSKYLKNEYPVTHRINLSKSTGIAIIENNLYCVYNNRPDESVYLASESTFKSLAEEIYKNAYGTSKIEASAILLSDNLKHNKSYAKIYKTCLTITKSKEDGENKTLKLITGKDWKKRLNIGLYGEYIEGRAYDGTMNNCPSWELISGNMKTIQTARERSMGRPVNFICLKEQEAAIKKQLTGMNYELTVLDKNQEEILEDFIKNFKKYNT